MSGALEQRLRELIAAEGIAEHLSRVYYANAHDPLAELVTELGDRIREEAASAKATEEAIREVQAKHEELAEGLRELDNLGRRENDDGDPVCSRTMLLRHVARLAYPDRNLDLQDPPNGYNIHRQTREDHWFQVFPHGFHWCQRCGVMARYCNRPRFFLPGTGELPELPACRAPNRDHVVPPVRRTNTPMNLPSPTTIHDLRPRPPLFGFPGAIGVTDRGTPYLSKPGVQMTARTVFNPEALAPFLAGFDGSLRFESYLNDTPLDGDGAAVAKANGQLCYLSFGPQRTLNCDAGDYFANILGSKHGSVLEAASFTFLFYGVSRSFTHELVRHRLAGYSQVSQRYVGGKTLRFVERPEYANDPELHALFCDRIDSAAREYERLTTLMADRHKPREGEERADRTARIKAVRQAARSCLPNETEAPIAATMNARAWRHFIEQRASRHAEPEIRRVGQLVLQCLQAAEPLLFGDYTLNLLPDGTYEATTPYVKV